MNVFLHRQAFMDIDTGLVLRPDKDGRIQARRDYVVPNAVECYLTGHYSELRQGDRRQVDVQANPSGKFEHKAEAWIDRNGRRRLVVTIYQITPGRQKKSVGHPKKY